MSELSLVGKSIPRIDADEKVRGKARFTGDLSLPHMLWGKILRSPYPHARILHIETARAEKLLGVRAVVTSKDFPDRLYGIGLSDEPLIARDRVRYIGEPVAAVAADDIETAEEALALIRVEYEELPAVFDPEEAMQENARVILHPDLFKYSFPTVIATLREPERPNVYNHFKIRRGDIERGFTQADAVIENEFTIPMLHHCQLEPEVTMAKIESDGGISVWTCKQSLYSHRRMLATALDIPETRITLKSSYVGGGFGNKLELKSEGLAIGLAMKSGRPVKIEFDREEQFIATVVRHPFIIYIKDGVKKDGQIVAREMKLVLNGGAYAEYGIFVVRNAGFGAASTYKIPNFKLDSYGVYTNLPIAAAYRGFGSSQTEVAVELQMDTIAEKLGIDPVELRMRHAFDEGDINLVGERLFSIGAKECLKRVADALEWGKKEEKARGRLRRGKGIALGNKLSFTPSASCALVKVREDESVEVLCSSVEMGQGINTVISQIAAEEFGVPISQVRLVKADTSITPYDLATLGSRSTFHMGNAVLMAVRDAKRQLCEIAAERLKAPPSDMEVKGGRIFVAGDPARFVRIADLYLTTFDGIKYLGTGGEIIGKATFSTYPWFSGQDIETGQSKVAGGRLMAFYTHMANGAEVEVDTTTGQVRVLRFISAMDVGKAINPKGVEGQIEGGIMMGIGQALFEEMKLDTGRVLNPNFKDYKVPTSEEVPTVENMISIIVETHPHKDGPFGAKGVGEATAMLPPAAIANAICDAIGVRICDFPLNSERIITALKDSQSSNPR